MNRLSDINNYIFGLDTEADISILENDPVFMLEVIKKTKDKRMYDFCTENVQRDYGFVYQLITFFKEDIEFIDKVADKYLLSLEEDDLELSFSIVTLVLYQMKNIKELSDLVIKYFVKAKALYEIISCCIIEAKGISQYYEKMEFKYILDLFRYDDFIKRYFAEESINKIFDINSDDSLYIKLSRIRKLSGNKEKLSDKDTLVKLIALYDIDLAGYAQLFPEMLKKYEKRLSSISSQSKFYTANKNDEILDFIEYYCSYSKNITLPYYDVLHYILYKTGLQSLLRDTYGDNLTEYGQNEYNNFAEEMADEEYYKEITNNLSFMELKDINELIVIVRKMYKSDFVKNPYEILNNLQNQYVRKGKLIQFSKK